MQLPSQRMSPASRYHSNLKVLRRRDPSINSIFDQFSHVCVYHHNGQKWQKHGFEGSMFLFERDSYPPYGFYILNRVGSDDYIQRLYPEDDITTHGGYLMLRSYPQLSSARMHAVSSSEGRGEPKFSELYAYVGDAAAVASKDKGASQTIGLWTFTTDGRESLMDVMLRLHSYIKKNLPYPEQYRYGPDKPPPSNPHIRAAAFSSTANISHNADGFDSNHVQQNDNRGLIASRAPSTPGNSDLDKLFAKFLPATTTSTSNDHGHGIAVPALNSFTAGIPGAAGNDSRSAASMSVQSLFASVTGPQQSQISTQIQPYLGGSGLPPSKLPLTMQQQPGPSTTGLSLLDSIFASAVPPPAAPPSVPLSQSVPQVVAGVGGQSQHVYYQQQQPSIDLSTMGSHPHPLPSTSTTYPLPVPFGASSLSRSLQPQPLQPIPVYSPTPKSLPAPQVLSQNVIGSLLNCGGNSSSGDGRQRQRGGGSVDSEVELESHPSSRDGDNELEELDDGSGGGGGASSEDGGREGRGRSVQMQGQGKGKKGKLDKGGKNVTTTGAGAGLNVISGAANSTVGGDVTPRPGFLVGDNLKNLIIPSGAVATTSSTTTAVATVSAGALPSVPTQKQKQKQRQKSKPRHGRPLVPFESSSVLWPYPPSQEHDMSFSDDHHDDELISESGNESSSTSLSRGGEGEEGEEEAILGGDIVELDWEDISALSDLKEFERVQREQQRQQERQQRKKKNEGKGNVVDTMNEQEEGLESIVGGEGRRRRKKKKNAKNKQERLEARAKEREEIENSWDFPVVTNLDSGVGSVADYGVVTNGGAIDMNGTGPGPGTETMNLNGKMVLIPKIFSDDSPPASPSPVPSPLAPLSPVRRQSLSPRVVLRKSDDDDDDDDIDDDDGGSEDEYECEDQSVVPARRRSLSPSPSQEREREVEVILSGNGSTRKKKNRRTLGTKAKKGGGGGVSSSLAPAVGDDTSVVSLLPAPATGDGSVDDTCQVKSEAMMDEERMTTSLLNVMRGEGIGSFERASPSANGKDAFVQELKRLMESEKFMNELWMGYSKSGEGGHGDNDNDDNDDSNTS